MPTYNFIAKNNRGEIKRGDVEGKDERSVVEQLRAEGFFVTTILEKLDGSTKTTKRGFKLFATISLKDRMMFARHLGVMISSGLSIPRALNVISSQIKNKKFKAILADLERDVKMGNTLADSLEKYEVFDELSTNMIRVGEVSGNMEEVLKLLADQLEKEHNLMSKVRGAMYYPAVILLVMVAIGIVMMIYVVPKLTAIFSEVDNLPFVTKLVISSSSFMAEHQILVIAGVLIIFFGIFVFFKTNLGKKISAFTFLRLPLIKNIVVKVNNARFARIYASLIRSGVSLTESLKIISNTLTNPYYRNALAQIKEGVQKGNALHEEIAKYPKLFPILLIQMVEVGEETGKTVDVLTDLAKFYEEEIDQITKNMSSIIEPVLMVVIGTAVGFFAISMIMPMYSVMEQM